jgi:esterase/lipase
MFKNLPFCAIRELFRMEDYVNSKIDQITTPFFVQHGSSDKMVNVEGSENLFQKAKSKKKDFKIYDGGYHCLDHDYVAIEVIEDTIHWLENSNENWK